MAKTRGICSIEGCGRPHFGRTWCITHYQRWRKHGDPLIVKRMFGWGATTAERFWAKVDKRGPIPEHRPDLGPCWLWTGMLNPNGYGKVTVNYKSLLAHRYAYELVNGPVPIGLQLDHLCHPTSCLLNSACPHRRCANPEHMEPATAAVNTLRSNGPAARNAKKTHCKRGHPFDDKNTYRDSRGYRACKACHRSANARTAREARRRKKG